MGSREGGVGAGQQWQTSACWRVGDAVWGSPSAPWTCPPFPRLNYSAGLLLDPSVEQKRHTDVWHCAGGSVSLFTQYLNISGKSLVFIERSSESVFTTLTFTYRFIHWWQAASLCSSAAIKWYSASFTAAQYSQWYWAHTHIHTQPSVSGIKPATLHTSQFRARWYS